VQLQSNNSSWFNPPLPPPIGRPLLIVAISTVDIVEFRAEIVQFDLSLCEARFIRGSMCCQVIAAEGEQRASKALKAAADIIDESKSALQLRYLQTLNQISAEKNSTIIFPMPIDFVANSAKGSSK